MATPLEMLTTVSQNIFNPCLRSHGIKTGRATLGQTAGGFVCAQIPVRHEASAVAGALSISVVSDCFADGGPQWAVFVCRIAVEGRQPLDKSCIFTRGDRLRTEFGELIESFVNAPESSGRLRPFGARRSWANSLPNCGRALTAGPRAAEPRSSSL